MSKSDHSKHIAQLFIREWMEAKGFDQQNRLADIMGRSTSAISKKLSTPERIDVEWLSEFAQALGISVPDLFRKPDTQPPTSPKPLSPRLAELMELAEGLSDKQIDHLIGLFFPDRAGAPQPEQQVARQD